MAVRKRYYIWLAKAYLKKWKKTILLSITIGVIAFFSAIFTFNFYIKPQFEGGGKNVGYKGSYTINTLPNDILDQVSYGLTKVSESGEIQPAAAQKWDIKENGKKYIFELKSGQKFHDGEELTAENIPLNFKEAEKKVEDKYTVSFTLKEAYAPFLVSVSKPILKQNLSGLGEYKIEKAELNAGFVESLTLKNKKNRTKKTIHIYPTENALKTAFALGEIDKAHEITNLSFKETDFASWKNTSVSKKIEYGEMVALFYNNNDDYLSDKKLRQALNMALPENLGVGIRADSPFPPNSIYYEKQSNYLIGDLSIAKEILNTSSAQDDAKFEITTLTEFENIAKLIQKSWLKLGIKTSIKVVSKPPENFQIFLYKFKIPQDPDQYTIWHSAQKNNIVGYQNLRIDKLLEDGRAETKTRERKAIYADFQKYLLDDLPVSFLYFPTEYILSRN